VHTNIDDIQYLLYTALYLSMFHQHCIKVTESEKQSDISSILPSLNSRADRVSPFMLGSSYTRNVRSRQIRAYFCVRECEPPAVRVTGYTGLKFNAGREALVV